MSFWGQRKSWRGLNWSLSPLCPMSQKFESHPSCQFVDSNPYLGEHWAQFSLNQSHQNTTTLGTCLIYLLGCSPCILQVCRWCNYKVIIFNYSYTCVTMLICNLNKLQLSTVTFQLHFLYFLLKYSHLFSLCRAATKTQRSVFKYMLQFEQNKVLPQLARKEWTLLPSFALHTPQSLWHQEDSKLYPNRFFTLKGSSCFSRPLFISPATSPLLLSGKNSLIALGFASDQLCFVSAKKSCFVGIFVSSIPAPAYRGR